MKRDQSSITAEGIALLRAMESEKSEEERICYDPLAKYLCSPWLDFTARFFMKIGYAERRGPGVQGFLVARTRYIDDHVQSCLHDSIRQLVILGAGYDTRAYRIKGLRERVKVFEVDHPATQQVKIARLKKALGALPSHVVYVPIDFDRETLDGRLAQSGYDPKLKTLFIWEGVAYYLSPDAVDRTLSFVAHSSGPDSSIIFDYTYRSVIEGTIRRGEVRSMRRSRPFTGEALIFGIPEGGIEEFLRARGFDLVENVTGEDLKRMYFTGANARRQVAPVYAIAIAAVRPESYSPRAASNASRVSPASQ